MSLQFTIAEPRVTKYTRVTRHLQPPTTISTADMKAIIILGHFWFAYTPYTNRGAAAIPHQML
jgi:hypothetical protein